MINLIHNSLQELILHHVDENSGGVKFMTLSLAVGKSLHHMKEPFIEPWEDNFPAELLSTIRSMPELEILTYIYKQSLSIDRLKYFIYRPLGPTSLEAAQRLSIPKLPKQIAA